MNEATAWRRALAQRIAAIYGKNSKVASVALAGSVARGWADRHSDIELDVYWHAPLTMEDRVEALTEAGSQIDIFWDQPPAEAEYQQIFERTGGHISQLWPYVPEENEWSEHYYVHGVNIGISSFLTTTIDNYLRDALDRSVTDDEQQMRLAALRHAVPLYGAEVIEAWQARTLYFPRALAVALVQAQLGRDEAWWASDMWVERGAHLALMQLFCHMQEKILRILLAVNGIYMPDPRFKWAGKLIEQMTIKPPDLALRMEQIFEEPSTLAATKMQQLMEETLALVKRHLPEIDVAFAERWLRQRRAVWDQAPATVDNLLLRR
jgi:predicted nucleotidyltransferase